MRNINTVIQHKTISQFDSSPRNISDDEKKKRQSHEFYSNNNYNVCSEYGNINKIHIIEGGRRSNWFVMNFEYELAQRCVIIDLLSKR